MNWTGEKLQARLVAQPETVTLVGADGTERRVTAQYAATEIAGKAFTGYGKNRVVMKLVAADAPRRLPAIPREIRAAMTGFPRLPPHVKKNPQVPGAKQWAPQPTFAHTGHAGKISTVFLSDQQEGHRWNAKC